MSWGLPVWPQTGPVGFPLPNKFFLNKTNTERHSYSSFWHIGPMAFARLRQRGLHVPPPVRIILYGLEAAQELITTMRDLRRTVRLMQSGLITLFPDEASGLHLLYSTLDRDLMQVERSSQFITLQLLTALAEMHEDIVQLAAFSRPATRGVWINQLYLVPAGRGSLTDISGSHPVPLDAHPFRIVVRTVHVTASLAVSSMKRH